MKIFSGENLIGIAATLVGVLGFTILCFIEASFAILFMSTIMLSFGVYSFIYNQRTERQRQEHQEFLERDRYLQSKLKKKRDEEWIDISDEMKDIIKK